MAETCIDRGGGGGEPYPFMGIRVKKKKGGGEKLATHETRKTNKIFGGAETSARKKGRGEKRETAV